MGSDEDAFVAALQALDGESEIPRHCKGHLHRMKLHGFIKRDSNGVWCLTEEGLLRAFPARGRLRVTRERVNDAINNEGAGIVRTAVVLYKTRTATEAMRHAWYTPDYAKTVTR